MVELLPLKVTVVLGPALNVPPLCVKLPERISLVLFPVMVREPELIVSEFNFIGMEVLRIGAYPLEVIIAVSEELEGYPRWPGGSVPESVQLLEAFQAELLLPFHVKSAANPAAITKKVYISVNIIFCIFFIAL